MTKVNLKINKSELNDITIDELQDMENGILEGISIINILRYIEYKEIPSILNIIKQKLSPTGEFIIKDIDIRQLAYLCLTQNINEQQLSEIIQQPSSLTSLFSISTMVMQSGLHITNKQLNNYEYILSGIKYEKKS